MVSDVDVFIIGGGINGAGIARDAAGRGFSTVLCEMNDLASGTSSHSSKLVHGGVRYLEHYEFLLVRKALKEREVLWSSAPHIIEPMRFILPHHDKLRPAWLLRLGLFLYDHLGGRRLLPSTKTVNLSEGTFGRPLQPKFKKGFQYSDCRVDDARLVILNAMDAKAKGAEILVQTRCISAVRVGDHWTVETQDQQTGEKRKFKARLIVNASGPWVDSVLGTAFERDDPKNVRMVKGSHIVVPSLFEHDNCYIFQNADDRVIFAIPYLNNTTLIGTTDQDYDGDPADVAISQEEIKYLCDAASQYFTAPVFPENIVWSYSGVRPLYDDGASAAQEATRDYVFKHEGGTGDDDENGAALINIFGGKITTFRELAENMMEVIEENLGRKGRPWTERAALPGGDFPVKDFDVILARVRKRYPFIDAASAERMTHAYGTKITMVLAQAVHESQLGEDFGHGLFEVEVRYLMTSEFARCADDIVWRRSKLGLVMSDAEIARLDKWMRDEG